MFIFKKLSLEQLWQYKPSGIQPIERSVQLDWLRVLAFGLLVFYHTGMLYSANWGFHFKSAYLSEGIENAMLLLSPWRMGLIWFISGAALYSLLSKQSLIAFLHSRTVRILLPLMVGIWLVVPFQLYAQMRQEASIELGFIDFYRAFFDLSHPLFAEYQAGIWPHVDVNHLWYLRSLWLFTLAIVLLLPALKSHLIQSVVSRIAHMPIPLMYICLLLPLCALKLNWPSETFRYPMGFVFLLYGFLLIQHKAFFILLSRYWQPLLVLFLVNYGVVVLGYQLIWQEPSSPQWQITTLDIIYTGQRLLGLMTALAIGMRFLTYSSPLLTTLNQWVFPFYIFHQSVLIALAYYLAPLQLGGGLEPMAIILLTFALCTLACIVITKVDWMKPLFGMKFQRECSTTVSRLGYIVTWVIIMPIALKLSMSLLI